MSALLAPAELHDNPCAQELGYRTRILAAMPHLEILDRHVVTAEEVQAAKVAHNNRKQSRGVTGKARNTTAASRNAKGVSARSASMSPMRASKASQLLSSTQRAHGSAAAAATSGGGPGVPAATTKITQLLDSEARKVRRQQRLAEIRAAQNLFQSGTAASRNMQMLGGAVPPSALTTTVLDGEVGVAAAGVAASMHSRGVQPHETSAMARAGWGILTATNQGALTASLRDMETQANPLHGSAGYAGVEFKPASTAAGVRAFRPGASGAARGGGGNSPVRNQSSFVPALQTGGSAAAGSGVHVRGGADASAVGLGPWEVYHVRRMFEAADSNGDGVLSPSELSAILSRAEEYGVALDGAGAAAAVQDTVQRMVHAADADGDGRLDWREFLGSIASGSGGVRFRCLSPAEARGKSDALFAKAARLQKRILRAAPGDARVQQWQSSALSLGERGGRLGELAARLEGKYDPPEAPPTPPPKRNGHHPARALVPVRHAAKTRQRGMRHYQVPAPGQESDSDSDEALPGALKTDTEYAQYRARRKNRKPHTVMTKTTFL